MFPFLKRKKKPLFSDEDSRIIVKAVRQAEENTSGEVRVFVESYCSWVNPLDRAAEIFFSLQMDKTDERNAVLVYVALKDRQLAVFGDAGIHTKVGSEYWNNAVDEMLQKFNKEDYARGIAECVIQVGNTLQHHFPYNKTTDKNELPDEIVFGR
jgi:uncharacterized membrane protein